LPANNLIENQPEEFTQRFARCYVGDVVIWRCPRSRIPNWNTALPCLLVRSKSALLFEDIQAVPFDAAAGVTHGPIRLAILTSGRPSRQIDCRSYFIAEVTLATISEKFYARYPGEVMEIWLQPAKFDTSVVLTGKEKK
jgi:tRNA(fMet)-specific endonuclease VapC